jgi:hypothetical protein
VATDHCEFSNDQSLGLMPQEGLRKLPPTLLPNLELVLSNRGNRVYTVAFEYLSVRRGGDT